MTTSYARIVDGAVFEVVNLVDGQTPQTNYTPEIAAMFVQCPANVQQFWTYVNGQWAAPVWASVNGQWTDVIPSPTQNVP